MRIDKWLWAVRIYKTRSLAAKQCAAGKVKRDGKALKSAANLKIGDLLEVPAADDTHKRRLEVVELLQKRVGAPQAQAAFRDHTPEDVVAAAKKKRAEKQAARQLRKEGDQGRLTKKQRRLWQDGIHRFGEDEGMDGSEIHKNSEN